MQPSAQIPDQLPHRRNEAWKWTDVCAGVTGQPSGLTSAGTPKFTVPDGAFISQGEGHIGEGAMAKFAANFAGESWNIYVPKDLQSDAPLMIDNIKRGHSRVAIMLDRRAKLNMIEYHRGDAGAFVNMDMQVHLAEGAELSRTIVHDDPADTVRITTTCVAAEKKAVFNQHTLSFGASLARLETRLYGEGEGIEANINGAYLLNGKRHTDMTSHIDLKATDAVIRQSVKGVVTDKARGVFQGKFHVHRPAQHTDAEMRHDALMLSDTAEVRAKPELEIYADNVACAHGNTIGQLDETALFYMRQRGIPLAQARSLLTEAFLASVFDDVVDEDLKESLLTKVRDWLEAQL